MCVVCALLFIRINHAVPGGSLLVLNLPIDKEDTSVHNMLLKVICLTKPSLAMHSNEIDELQYEIS